MLRIAIMKESSESASDGETFAIKAHDWLNERQPAGMETLGIYKGLGAHAPGIYLFKSHSSRDVDKLLGYWREFTFDIYLALDWCDLLPHRGVSITRKNGAGSLYLAFMNKVPSWALEERDFTAKLDRWFGEARSVGLSTVGLYKALGTHAPTIYVFTTHTHDALLKFLTYWQEFPCEIYPALDWLALPEQTEGQLSQPTKD